MTARLPMGVQVCVHINETVNVECRPYRGQGFALVRLSNEFTPTLDLFFRDVADLDRVLDGLTTARHELAALTEQHEPHGETASTTMATHANAA